MKTMVGIACMVTWCVVLMFRDLLVNRSRGILHNLLVMSSGPPGAKVREPTPGGSRISTDIPYRSTYSWEKPCILILKTAQNQVFWDPA